MAVFTTAECAWSQTSLKVLGRTVLGVRGFEVDVEVEKEHVYAAGSDPIDIADGNRKPTGNFKLMKFEVDKMNDAALAAGFTDITQVPHTAITATVAFKKTPTSPMRTIQVLGIAFTKMTFSMEQGAKLMEVPLPFLAMKVQPV